MKTVTKNWECSRQGSWDNRGLEHKRNSIAKNIKKTKEDLKKEEVKKGSIDGLIKDLTK